MHVNLNTTDSCANTLLHGVTHVSVYAYKDIQGKCMQAECLSKIVSPGLLHSCDHAPSAQMGIVLLAHSFSNGKMDRKTFCFIC